MPSVLENMQVWSLKDSKELYNIAMADVIPVETLRLGLRGDTLARVHGARPGGQAG